MIFDLATTLIFVNYSYFNKVSNFQLTHIFICIFSFNSWQQKHPGQKLQNQLFAGQGCVHGRAREECSGEELQDRTTPGQRWFWHRLCWNKNQRQFAREYSLPLTKTVQ